MDAALLGPLNNSVASNILPKPNQIQLPPNGHSFTPLSCSGYESHLNIDHHETCSISSMDAAGTNDLKFMDDSSSSSSSSASSFSGSVDPSSDASPISGNTRRLESVRPSLLAAAGLTTRSEVMSNSLRDVDPESVRLSRNALIAKSSSATSSATGSPSSNTRVYNFPSRIPVATRSSIPKPMISPPKSVASLKQPSMPTLRQNAAGEQLRGTHTNHCQSEACTSVERLNGSHPFTQCTDPCASSDLELCGTRNGEIFSGLCDKLTNESGDVLTPHPIISLTCPPTVDAASISTALPTTERLLRLNNPNEDTGKSHFQRNGFPYVADSDPSADHRLLALLSDSESDTESIAESIYHQPPKAADRGAASRLAKRLFHLDGFRITDVAKHLCKRNDFSQLVGEEFAGLFDFSNQRLDVALRSFLNTFSLTGETQERERILLHFSRRYHACNPDAYLNEDACHTLVCALMLLNTDLHNQGVTRKMSCQEFIQNLSQMHCGDCFSREDLKTLYNAIKQEPVRWPHSDANMMSFVNFYYPGPPNIYGPAGPMPAGFIAPPGFYPNPHTGPIMFAPPGQNPGVMSPYPIVQYSNAQNPISVPVHTLMTPNGALPTSVYWNGQSSMSIGSVQSGTSLLPTTVTDSPSHPDAATHNEKKVNGQSAANSSLDLSVDTNAREYMRGFLVRKWVMECYGKKTSLGRRGWKVYYARLRDLALCLYKNAIAANAACRAEEAYQLHQQQQQQQQQLCLNQFAAMQQQTQQHQQPQRFCLPPLAQPQRTQLNETTDPDDTDNHPIVTAEVVGHEISTLTSLDIDERHSPIHDSTVNASHDAVTSQCEQLVSSLSSCSPSSSAATSTLDSIASVPSRSTVSTTYTSTIPSLSFPVPAFLPPPIPAPETVVRIAHAFASRATNYVKKQNVFRLRTREGAEYLFEVHDAKELDLWIERINFVAALLSAPAMPGPIGSERGFYRPHLPVSCTKLNIREQLEEHQRRLIELGRELDDLRKRLGSGDTKSLRSARKSDESIKGTDTNDGPSDIVKKEDSEMAPKTDTRTSSEPDNNVVSTASSAMTTTTSSLSSATSSIISVFSTGSLGRRRKTSLSSLSVQSADCPSPPVLTSKQRAELEERIQFTECEIQRYKTYARLLESELFRIQQSSAAVVHAAALAAANNFTPYVGPYGFSSAVSGLPSFQHFSHIGMNQSFPTPPPPRYFLPRTHSNPFTPSQLTPLAVLGPAEVLNEEPSQSNPSVASDDETATLSSSDSSECSSANVSFSSVPPLPLFSGKAQYGLPCQYYGPQLQLPTPFSPATSGRFYSNPRQWRGSHCRQPLAFNSAGRSNGILLNGERLTEEEAPPIEASSSTLSCDAPSDDSTEASTTRTLTASSVSEKFKTPSAQPVVCSPDGMFYEIV